MLPLSRLDYEMSVIFKSSKLQKNPVSVTACDRNDNFLTLTKIMFITQNHNKKTFNEFIFHSGYFTFFQPIYSF